MTQPGHARSKEARAPSRGPRHRLRRRSAGLSVRTGAKAITAVVSAATLILTGMGWIGYRHISAGITTSEALAGVPGLRGYSIKTSSSWGLIVVWISRARPLP